ncbi:MAG: hypothetical protein KBE30_02105 [Desulfobacter sp.]|jgi:hypothetical protein|nr:hypothetical protein [Desulfobacter sp.]
MEDISRELEREIARIKPRPHKTRKENNILIINDFGEIRSGAFLKVLVYFLGVISLAGGYCYFLSALFQSESSNCSIKEFPGRFSKKSRPFDQ